MAGGGGTGRCAWAAGAEIARNGKSPNFVFRVSANDDYAAGLLIQRLPVEGRGNLEQRHHEDDTGIDEAFNRIAHLTATLTRE